MSESKDYCLDCNEPLELYPSGQSRPPCPKCGSTKRKRVVTINEKVIIDSVDKYSNQIKRLKEFQKIYKGTKVEENLEFEVKKLENITEDLLNTLPDQCKEVDLTVGKQPTKKPKNFTVDAILSDKIDSKIEEGDEVVKRTTDEIFEKLEELQKDNQRLHKSNTKLSMWGIIGTVGGIIAGLIGSYLITIATQPQIIIVNATNGTIMP